MADDTLLIEAYLLDQMPTEDRQAFEQRLAQEPALVAEVALYANLFAGIRAAGRHMLKHDLQQLEAEETPTSDGQAPWRRLASWWVAAVVTLLLVAGGFWWQNSRETEVPDRLFLAYFEPYPNVVQTIERGDQATEPLPQALQRYEQGRFPAAATQLQALMDSAPDNDTLLFYLGNTLLALGEPLPAQRQFERVLLQPGSVFETQARWYLALSLVAQQNTAAAKGVLDELARSDEALYQQRARALRSRL